MGKSIYKKSLLIIFSSILFQNTTKIFPLSSQEKAKVETIIGQTINSASIFGFFAAGLSDKSDPLSEIPVMGAVLGGGAVGLYSSIVLFEEKSPISIENTQGLNSSIFWNNLWSFNLSTIFFGNNRKVLTGTSLLNTALSALTFFNIDRLNVSSQKTNFVNFAGGWGIAFVSATAFLTASNFTREQLAMISLLGSASFMALSSTLDIANDFTKTEVAVNSLYMVLTSIGSMFIFSPLVDFDFKGIIAVGILSAAIAGIILFSQEGSAKPTISNATTSARLTERRFNFELPVRARW